MCLGFLGHPSPVGTTPRWVQVNAAHTVGACHGGRTPVEETTIFLKREFQEGRLHLSSVKKLNSTE